MGRKKKKFKPIIFCYYCDRTFETEKILIQHQRAKHFKCVVCHKRLGSAHGMMVHVFQVHKQQIDKVPCAKEGRDSFHVDIFGMSNVPQDIIDEKHAERGGEPPAKKQKVNPPQQQQPAAPVNGMNPMMGNRMMMNPMMNRMNPMMMNGMNPMMMGQRPPMMQPPMGFNPYMQRPPMNGINGMMQPPQMGQPPMMAPPMYGQPPFMPPRGPPMGPPQGYPPQGQVGQPMVQPPAPPMAQQMGAPIAPATGFGAPPDPQPVVPPVSAEEEKKESRKEKKKKAQLLYSDEMVSMEEARFMNPKYHWTDVSKLNTGNSVNLQPQQQQQQVMYNNGNMVDVPPSSAIAVQ